jgi:chemotaxis family two-component system response regulator Rcp1
MKAPYTILLVEDNAGDVKIMQRALRTNTVPVELVVVRDGQAAIDYLAQPPDEKWRYPNLILLDLNMPGLTGRQVLERIRATPSVRSVPVVVLTTSRREDEVADLYAAGANTYIQKPQDFKRFVEVLHTIQRYWLETALLPSPP